MKHHGHYKQKDEAELRSLIDSQNMCILITENEGKIESGVFNPYFSEGKFLLHLNRSDSQYRSMAQSGRANLVFFDFLANIPSYWVDEKDGGKATSYYRFAEFRCSVRVYENVEDIARLSQKFLDRYQAEGGYSALMENPEIYKKSFLIIAIAELEILETITKWKLGQNYPVEKRLGIVEKLEQRGDTRAAAELMRWIQASK